jgi:putative hemolysin
MEFAIILVLIAINGIFAMSEMAIVSSRKARLQQQAEGGSRGAAAAVQLADEPGHFLSTVQVGITTIGILNGAFGEDAIGERLVQFFNGYPLVAPYSKVAATVVMVSVITYLSVVLGELVPKRLALQFPERIAALIARPMQALSRVVHPVVTLFSWSSALVLALFGIRRSTEPPVTEDEIRVMIDQGTQAGVFKRAEQRLVNNVFQLDDLRVASIMTPRRNILFLDIELTFDANRETLLASKHHTLPVCRGGLDDVVGVIEVKDLLARYLRGDTPDIGALVHRPLVVPEGITLMRFLESFQRSHEYMALIVDEYGAIEGLVTLTDVLEAVVGDLPRDSSPEGPVALRRDDGSWLLDGTLTIPRCRELIEGFPAKDAEAGRYQTIAGYVLARLGHVPMVGEHLDSEGWRFEIVDMDGHRIDKLLLLPSEPRQSGTPT